MKRMCYIFLLFCLSLPAAAQVSILSGTSLSISAGTNVRMMDPGADTLIISSGANVINNGIITLSPSSVISEQPGSPVSGAGYESHTAFYSTPLSGNNPGGLGLIVSTSIAPDSFTVRRYHTSLLNAGINSVERSYEVISENNTGLGATVQFNYDATELNGADLNTLMLYNSNNGGSSWDNYGGTAAAGSVQSAPAAFDSLAWLTLFPFELRIDSINALTFYQGDTIRIYYTLSGTLNADNYLRFEFSDSTGAFSPVLILDSLMVNSGSGVLIKTIPLSMTPASGYRLRLSTSNIPLISSDNGNDITILDVGTSINEAGTYFTVYPNPVKDLIHIRGKEITRIIISDELGRTVSETKAGSVAALNVNVDSLIPAVYFISIQTSHGIYFRKFIKF